MDLNLDIIIFVSFLFINIIFGLGSSFGIKSIKEYAIGDRNFSTATLVATIVATWVSGAFFFNIASETYSKGLNFIWVVVLADFLCIFSIGYFFAPRMGEFLGKLSIAEAMGDLFGPKVRIATSIASFIGVCGIIGIQFKIAGMITEYAIGISGIYGILASAIIVTLYSALGGIKSVTFTDVIQFFTFSIVIPVIAYFILTNLSENSSVLNVISSHPLFDYKSVFDFSQAAPWHYLFLFFYGAIPGFNPAIFQRIAIAKDIMQVRYSFMIAAFTCLLLVLIVCWIGVLTLAAAPDLPSDDIIKFILSHTSSVIGLKGLILVGIMAMIMSTVDSYINSTAVLLVHDFFKPLKFKFINNELVSARTTSLLIGVVAFFLSIREANLFNLMVITYSFYMPIVTVPFIMAIFGFRSTGTSVLIGMLAGLSTVLLWDYVFRITLVNSVPVGMMANLIFLMGSHYLLKQEGGWVGIKDTTILAQIQQTRAERMENLWDNIRHFNFIETCKNNYPAGEGMTSVLGFFVMIVSFSSVSTLAISQQNNFANILDILYPLTLCSCSALISYPLWLQSWKDSRFIAVIWNLIMFFILICFSFLTVLISNFADIQLIVFMMNMIMIMSLIKWYWALLNLILGIGLTTCLFYYYVDASMYISASSSQSKTIYLLILSSSALVLFLKPKQEYIEKTEVKINHLNNAVKHYSEKVEDQAKEIERLGSIAQKILDNVNHELRLPIGNVMNFADMIKEALQNSDNNLVKELAQELHQNSTRVSIMILNMLDLATLDASKVQLNKVFINFSELVTSRAQECYKLYVQNKKLELKFAVQPEIMIALDPNYMRQAIDNLVINAINFTTEGTVSVHLYKVNGGAECLIQDEGLGISRSEANNIFTPFKVYPKTSSKASGRSVGLALCKAAVEVHGGEISVYSNGRKGAILRFYIPFCD